MLDSHTPPNEHTPPKFFLNPLECLLPSDTVSTGSEFVKPGTAAAFMVRRITNNILTFESSSMSKTRAYSPSFRCNTGLPFYASLLRELKSLVNEIDYQPSVVRGLVWAQLFAIVGTQQRYDGLFGPVLKDTMSQPSVNLLDIEVLLVSFLLVINRYPQILDGDMTDVPLEPSEAQREELEKQAQQFFAQFRTRPAFVNPVEHQDPVTIKAKALQSLAPRLHTLPDEQKVSIWEQCHANPVLVRYARYLTSQHAVPMVNEWVSNLPASEPIINAFYDVLYPPGGMPVFDGCEMSQQLKDTISPFPSRPPSPRTPPAGPFQSQTLKPHPMKRHASAPEGIRRAGAFPVIPSPVNRTPPRGYSPHRVHRPEEHDPSLSVYSALRQQQEHTEINRPKKPFPFIRARSATSAFSPISPEIHAPGVEPVLARPAVPPEEAIAVEKEADELLASLLKGSGGSLPTPKPTGSPHFGRFYPPPRNPTLGRSPGTEETMDVEDR